MSVDLSFAIRVLRLNRLGFSLSEIASIVDASEAAALEAHRMLGIALSGEMIDTAPRLSDRSRAAMLGTMPKRMADRIRRIEAERKRH